MANSFQSRNHAKLDCSVLLVSDSRRGTDNVRLSYVRKMRRIRERIRKWESTKEKRQKGKIIISDWYIYIGNFCFQIAFPVHATFLVGFSINSVLPLERAIFLSYLMCVETLHQKLAESSNINACCYESHWEARETTRICLTKPARHSKSAKYRRLQNQSKMSWPWTELLGVRAVPSIMR